MYTENQVVRVAKRENNTKRKYLVVNRLQGKHVPVLPSQALSMFYELKTKIQDTYSKERLLLIGFAETATAIGAAIATQMNCYYIQTTREIIEGVTYFFFSEAHSHATEQKLVKDDLDQVISCVDRVIFVEDEVTTGNTIMNIINLMKKEYESNHINFSVASIINGMDSICEQRFDDAKIGIHYLIKTENQKYEAIADQFQGNGSYYDCNGQKDMVNVQEAIASVQEIKVNGSMNARRICDSIQYQKACNDLWLQIEQQDQSSVDSSKQNQSRMNTIKQVEQANRNEGNSILVLGTEEFMYPALYVASMLEQQGKQVRFHATTRSPILVDTKETYPLHERYQLCSLYDSKRVTFIYDLAKYDKVYIITDAGNSEKEGLESLLAALSMSGNDNISVIRWC